MKITDSEKEFLQRLLEGEKITCSTKWAETHIFGENKKELDSKTFYSLKTKGLIYAKNTTLKNYNVEITINGIRVINGKPTTEEIKTQDILEKPQPETNFEILPVKKENNEEENPETLGIVSLSHCQSNIFLHGSEQKHHHCVKLTINTAYSNKTEYGNRYYFPKDTIFEGAPNSYQNA